MSDASKPTQPSLPDPVKLADAMQRVAERSRHLLESFAEKQQKSGAVKPGPADPLGLTNAFVEYNKALMADPAKLMEAQLELWRQHYALWQASWRKFIGEAVTPMAEPAQGDRRFKDPAWSENAVFDWLKQSYLLTSRWMTDIAGSVDGLSEKDRQKVDFYTRQMVDAMSPSNFALTNPAVLRATAESGGDNLVHGLENLLTDLERGHIAMTDEGAFRVGENIAASPGKVVFQNALIQLIQFTPSTEEVHQRPLLIVPPWINKFYILDLKPENSFIRWAVEQGHTVFVVSWINPDASLRDKGFGDYMADGVLASLDVIREITGEPDANVIGYCIGGTLLGCTLAWLTAKGEAERVASATFFVSMLDFSEAGEITVFIDEEQIQALEAKMAEQGYLGAIDLHTTFNLLRSNDLIWSFVVNNYLLGKDPFPFDLLYWNSDSTNLTEAMHSFYLRNMYQQNALVQPGAVELKGEKIDLSSVKTPACFIAAKEDHICPWRTVYKSSRALGGPTRFILAGSGHIAGIVNPPAAEKYNHWTNSRNAREPETWLKGATDHKGSWWPEWQKWVEKFTGGKVPARAPGSAKYKPIEDAPGSYVKVRAM